MSRRNSKVNRQDVLTPDEVASLRKLNARRLDKSLEGMSTEHVEKIIQAEDSMFESSGDGRVAAGYEQISDVPTEVGNVIRNPLTGQNTGILTKDGGFLDMKGRDHPSVGPSKQRMYDREKEG